MSTPSSNVMVICESPNLDSERSSIMPGRPANSISTGMVTRVSISSGARAGTSVLIWICGFVMSGTASTGRRDAAHSPTPIRMSEQQTISPRLRSEKSMSRSSISVRRRSRPLR